MRRRIRPSLPARRFFPERGCGSMRADGFDVPSSVAIAITRDGLFDDAVLERAAALGWRPPERKR